MRRVSSSDEYDGKRTAASYHEDSVTEGPRSGTTTARHPWREIQPLLSLFSNDSLSLVMT
jgi:hypothetical protein